ncbi:hypothetical protein LCGC14_1406210 [marine sediment metagenome]|uniref:G-protein coupled receptors family 1 profile domain-containing protein n=1 Tax=marine sediment metagenome TaxID=412755 RepID=A0A0F9JVZ0_9ZZZZ
MLDLHILLMEILIILSIYIILFLYSVISADMITTLLSFLIFLILLMPLYLLLDRMELQIFISNLKDVPIFKIFLFYSTLVNLFIGVYLFVELVYLFFYA